MQGIEYIQALNLDYLIDRLVTKENWDKEEAVEAVRKYKNFLTLGFKYPKLLLVPSPDIDEVWHAHILHTREYMHDCSKIFGAYRHHAPSNEQFKISSEEVKQTHQLYMKEFGETISGILDIQSFW